MTWGYVFFAYVLIPAAFVAYLWLGIWSVRRVARATLPVLARGLATLLLVAVFVAVPFGDEIVGRYRFAQLCESEAAMKVYRVASLEPKYLRADGWPTSELLPDRSGIWIARRYVQRVSQQEIFARPKIVKTRTEIRDEVTSDVLGEIVDFGYSGGWLVQQLPGHAYGENCPSLREKRASLQKAVFPSSAK
jgi:hypothetical protein